MALFSRDRRPIEDLIRKANSVFEKFSSDDEYLESAVRPLLVELCVAVKADEFRTVDELEAVAAPLRSMPPVTAAFCAASVLHTGGRVLAKEPLGESLTHFIATAGMAGAWKAVTLVEGRQSVHNLISSLDVLWRYEPSPYREFDHAQTVYVSGHLALGLGLDHDTLASRWRQALRLLAEADPTAARSAAERDKLAHTKRHLEQEWRAQLASLSATS
ncbi:hypothetical protein [Streptomyces sp. HUAS TT20]|uniref:hypothetical protein n=1 Tax=Streptomyces sp. HUAS TT20 TaxID=3447509 RepID=UPI0021DAFCBE|nr:hypothetical protein [Streptomyces sp. HUAS 15-9]UXY27236.1 hypothetical protein N8I87_11965 [Streptomyces sp. HUAS 15-9]